MEAPRYILNVPKNYFAGLVPLTGAAPCVVGLLLVSTFVGLVAGVGRFGVEDEAFGFAPADFLVPSADFVSVP